MQQQDLQDQEVLSRLLLEADPVALAPNAPLLLQMHQSGALAAETETLPPIVYKPQPIISPASAAHFLIFVAASWVPLTPFLWLLPSQIFSLFGSQEVRTLMCALFTWNLIGATLFSRMRLHRHDLTVILTYILLTPVFPLMGFICLPILGVQGNNKLTHSKEQRDVFKRQMIIIAVFGMPAIIGPFLAPAFVTILHLLLYDKIF